MARPCKLTPETQARYCESLRLGSTRDLAARAAGLGPSTVRAWFKRKGAVFTAFREAVEKAEAECVDHCLQKIRQASESGKWQASAWLLERRYPETYGRRQAVAVSKAPERLTVADVTRIEQAAAHGIGMNDGAAIWARQLTELERAYQSGQVDASTYFRALGQLGTLAARFAEIEARREGGEAIPPVQLKITLESEGIKDAAPNEHATGKPGPNGDRIDIE